MTFSNPRHEMTDPRDTVIIETLMQPHGRYKADIDDMRRGDDSDEPPPAHQPPGE